jgi:hypothetical protein
MQFTGTTTIDKMSNFELNSSIPFKFVDNNFSLDKTENNISTTIDY